MKYITRKYVYDGNLFHLIIGVIVFTAKITWSNAIAFLQDLGQGIYGVAIMIWTLLCLIGLIVYAPFRPIVWFVQALWVLRLRKMATPNNIPNDKLLWHPDDGVFTWGESQTTYLEGGLYFIPNKRDLRKYNQKLTKD